LGSHRAAIPQGWDRLLKLPPKFRNHFTSVRAIGGRHHDLHQEVRDAARKERTMATETKVKYSGTKGFNVGGNTASTGAGTEKHNGPYAKGEKCGQDSSISKKTN
jgi:hypothetical protein